jgi:hypothetical protein
VYYVIHDLVVRKLDYPVVWKQNLAHILAISIKCEGASSQKHAVI